MFDHAARFTGNIPKHYDSELGHHLFVDYAADLTRRAAATKPTRVLEIAAGTGIVTRMLRNVLPDSAVLVASDLNPSMLAVAQRKFGATEQIRLPPGRRDCTTVRRPRVRRDRLPVRRHVLPDKDKGYREVYRVLGRGGRYHFNVWDSFDFNPFARISHETVGGFFNGDVPAFFTVPFGYHRIDEIKSSLLAAGFTELAVHVLKIDKTITTAGQFAEGLVLGNPIIEEIRSRGTTNSATIVAAVTEALQSAFGENPGRMPLQAIVFSALKW